MLKITEKRLLKYNLLLQITEKRLQNAPLQNAPNYGNLLLSIFFKKVFSEYHFFQELQSTD